VTPILDVVVALHEGLEGARVPHAFGGAFALLWCTGEPRGTVDIDLNVFVAVHESARVLAALPEAIEVTADDLAAIVQTGQRRLYYEQIPVDLFFDTTGFHADLGLHVARHRLAERDLPFLGCNDLAVFKAFFNRRKDWADLEAMALAGHLDVAYVTGVLAEYLGPDDERITELHQLRDEIAAARGGPSH
jgi:hypothetical protein